MTEHARLTRPEIAILKILFRANATHAGVAIFIKAKLRPFVSALWKRGFVEVWLQQIPGEGSRGPLYALSQNGLRLIQALLNAREELPRKNFVSARARASGLFRGITKENERNGQSSQS